MFWSSVLTRKLNHYNRHVRLVLIFTAHLKSSRHDTSNFPPNVYTHFISPQRDSHHLPRHVHQTERPLGNFSVGLGGEAGHFVHTLTHSNHICNGRQESGLHISGRSWMNLTDSHFPVKIVSYSAYDILEKTTYDLVSQSNRLFPYTHHKY